MLIFQIIIISLFNLVAMPVSRKEMEKYQNMQTRQVGHATKQWEARANKVANNAKRRQWIERQNNVNYRNEYDRIREELGRGRLPYLSILQLRQRQAELERFFLAQVYK